MQIDCLSNASVFCCDCQIKDGAIAVGIICINWDSASKKEELINHETGDRYLVEIPRISTPAYKQNLKIL
jgi:hypothetical protein